MDPSRQRLDKAKYIVITFILLIMILLSIPTINTQVQIYKAEHGDIETQYTLGIRSEQDEDHKKAVYWYRKAAYLGHADSQESLAYMYEVGQGLKQDKKEAFYWYLQAAEQGIAHAQFSVGYGYYHGIGTYQNIKKAILWYRKAAKQGNLAAQKHLKELNEAW